MALSKIYADFESNLESVEIYEGFYSRSLSLQFPCTYITHKIFGKNYVAIHEVKPVLWLNKPSKWLMYDFYYNFVKKHFDAELLFTGTDSITYEIKSEDVYEEFFKYKHLFDFSNHPKSFLTSQIRKLLVK